MAKKQSRKSVSISGPTYARLRAWCEVNDVSMSETVEGRLGDFLGRPATAKAERVAEKPAKAAKPVAGEKLKARDLGKGPGLRTGQIFTF